jgi:hypothetical protein
MRLGVERPKAAPIPDFLGNDGTADRLVLFRHEHESQTAHFPVGGIRDTSLELKHVTNERAIREVDDLHAIDGRVIHQFELAVRSVIIGSQASLSDAARYQIIGR